MKGICILGAIVGFFLTFCPYTSSAETIIMKTEFTNVTPIFMDGHMGDQDWIEGYSLKGDIFLGNEKIGTVDAKITLFNPPADLTQKYDEAFGIFNNTITNLGSFQIYAQLRALSTNAMTGEGMTSWHGTIANGSEGLQGLLGLSSGVSSFNLFTGKGSGLQLLNF